MDDLDKDWVVLGRVQGYFGVAGWVKIYSFTHEMPDILAYPRWWLQQGQEWRPYRLVNGRVHGKTIIAQLEGVADRNQAAALFDCLVAVPRTELPALDKGEYYWSQLISLDVINVQGEKLGVVDFLFETGANDVLAVKTPLGEQILIPYLDSTVLGVDLTARAIEVDWQADY